MPAKCYFALLLLFGFPLSSFAINVGSITTILASDKELVGKVIKNESTMGRIVTVRVDRLDSPLAQGKIIPFETGGELLLAPSQLMMPGESKNIIKFWYQGKKDAQERYYRLTFTDEPINEDNSRTDGKSAVAQARATVSTILVVQPKQKKLDYAIVNGGVMNKGNVSFRITAMGTCLANKKECRETFYVMPGRTYTLRQVNLKAKGTHLGLWDIDKYIPLQ